MMSNKRIEVGPGLVKTIQSMPIPKTEKAVKKFLERLNYIARFISQLITTCDLVFDC